MRGVKHVVAVGDFYDEEQLHCMYKVDSSADIVIENALNTVDTDGAVGEAEYHKFWGELQVVFCGGEVAIFLETCNLCG